MARLAVSALIEYLALAVVTCTAFSMAKVGYQRWQVPAFVGGLIVASAGLAVATGLWP